MLKSFNVLRFRWSERCICYLQAKLKLLRCCMEWLIIACEVYIFVCKGFLCEKWNLIQLKFDQIVWLEKIRFHLQKFISSLSRFVGNIGIIVGAVFGSVAALAVAGILVWWTCRKKRRNTKGTEGKCCIHVMLSNEQ